MANITNDITELPASCKAALVQESRPSVCSCKYADISPHANVKIQDLERELGSQLHQDLVLVAYRMDD